MELVDIAPTLTLMAELLEIHGENPFKVRAYEKAARALKDVPHEKLETLIKERRLTEISGIGKGIAETITELVETGRSDALDTMRQGLPAEFPDMMKIPGLGPRKIKQLYDDLGIDTLRELEYALEENRLVDLPGFGAKTQEKIRQGLSFLLANRGRYLLSDSLPLANALQATLEAASGRPIDVAGEVRRARAIVEEIVLLIHEPADTGAADSSRGAAPLDSADLGHESVHTGAAGSPPGTAPPDAADVGDILTPGLTRALQQHLGRFEVDRCAPNVLKLVPVQGPRVVLEVASSVTLAARLCWLTGSDAHLEHLARHAASLGLTLRADGLFRDEVRVPASSEQALYEALGLGWIPPELREDTGEIEAAASAALPTLIEREHLKGVFHVHTTWSDGSASIEQMAVAAAGEGLAYLGISDHSKAAGYAHGLDEQRLAAQWDEIDAYNGQVASHGQGPWIFKGSEVDILPDGRLDLDDAALERLDFVIASVHSSFNQPGPEVTARIIRAISHPKVTMLGHPTGRLLLGRSGYAVDLEEVLQAAARHGTVIEINANPHRLDLPWRWIKRGRTLGVRFAINPDAHSPRGFKDVAYGIGNARRGWLTGDDVINTMGLPEMKRWLLRHRETPHV